MIHPIPPGTRDVLPDEMHELRRLNRALVEVFEARGYGEVATPTIEYDEVLARGDSRASSAYRFFDENGEMLALRTDMTVPIARLVAGRFADAEPPLRLCYLANAYSAVRPQRGQMREFSQAGVELIGGPAPDGTAEVVEVLEAALDAAGLDRAVIGLGDADLYRQLLAEFGIAGEARDSILARLAAHDLVGLETELSEAGNRRRAGRHLRHPLAAARGARGARAGAGARWGRGRAGDGAARRDLRGARARAASPSGSRSTSACCATSATTTGRSSRSTTRRSATCSSAAVATTGCCGNFGARPAGRRLRPLPGARPRRPDGGAAAGEGGVVSVSVAGWPRGPRRPAEARGPARRPASARPSIVLDGDRRRHDAELRGESRSLIFPTDDLTLVTMRPSDVPTYVEAGAADVGITGKDVILEQADRVVYELLDLGFGRCRMVLAGRRGDTRLGESQRRLGNDADRDQVPAHRRAPLRANRSPG